MAGLVFSLVVSFVVTVALVRRYLRYLKFNGYRSHEFNAMVPMGDQEQEELLKTLFPGVDLALTDYDRKAEIELLHQAWNAD